MNKTVLVSTLAFFLFISTPIARAGFFDDLLGGLFSSELTLEKTISGLKEALSIGTNNTVVKVSEINGYFKNPDIKIFMPEKIQSVADFMQKLGYGDMVDEFILSMNQAAEKASPKARQIFLDAIMNMTFEDAKKILNGGDTAATEYLQSKTYIPISAEFTPLVSASLDEVGATRHYKNMMQMFSKVPLVTASSFDLDHYVTTKALDGLYFMVGEEEKKIRHDPKARVTDLLKEVFDK
ncbi:MAG: DUF4197 domain-containing protein [Nitrospinae bacterium]|nr:DUF4197 domain-containing protein [Nitrospinota bacterium]